MKKIAYLLLFTLITILVSTGAYYYAENTGRGAPLLGYIFLFIAGGPTILIAITLEKLGIVLSESLTPIFISQWALIWIIGLIFIFRNKANPFLTYTTAILIISAFLSYLNLVF